MSAEAAFRAFLNDVRTALDGGEAQDIERRAKAVSALVRAERDVAEYLSELQSAANMNDEDVLRTELQRRLALFAAASDAGDPPEVLERIAAEGVRS